MGPEESMQFSPIWLPTIAMAFDECIENPAEYDYVKKSVARTTRVAPPLPAGNEKTEQPGRNAEPHQMLFGINQGKYV